MNATPPPHHYSVSEATVYLQLGDDSVYEIVGKEQITSRRKGPKLGRIYFLQEDLDDYIASSATRKRRR
jgi:hypothetical protein